MKTPKPEKIFRVNCIFLVIFIITIIITNIIPKSSSSDRYADISDLGYSADNEWALFLINPENPLPEGYLPELKSISGSFLMDARCAYYASVMMDAAEKDGIKLMVASAYRSMQKQQENLEQYITRLINNGYSKHEAEKLAALEIAPPGASEHNAGLAVDFLTEDWWLTHNDVTADFDQTKEYRWLESNSWKYGFILRYPKDSTEITGFAYEPWHYRFVGIYHAEKIHKMGITLEEYIK